MSTYLLLLAPAANRVYAGESDRLAAAELAICHPGLTSVEARTVAGVGYLSFQTPTLDSEVVARASASLALFEVEGELLRPVELPRTDWLDEDLVTIPKYPGKTNEQFTRLLLNVTLAQVRGSGGALEVLDPLAGRGTTLTTAWMLGHDGFGVEGDPKAVEQMAAFLKTWLRRKRLKHTADMTPVRREGRSLGRRFDATVRLPGRRPLTLGVFTGDTRTSAQLWGRRTFDAVVADLPYGVVHGAADRDARRDRSPQALLEEALPVWVSQLKPGGAIGLSWNTHGLARETLVSSLHQLDLRVMEGGPWLDFSHRVDSSIQRDLVVAVR
ncbi:site-specific DNA-methyltransferase [Aestuariimicrobium sp. p3-SID1156]|uniref:TRM11 family SAM-dependent methyltransferase n=1 Tax=Aestuariimicrobium sp. p3-SID1156 TaxID=2916038 RepID=UPI00223B3CF7|nr:site-specific DNA-methyltransferase [Aestuariimicrobium sp. p3-SID1156]MCT1458583.1 site-specific DNA-methyltransferase [Aestuariimicrobium sp. p3-SID1156]